MVRLFADLPEALANTLEISSRLEFTLDRLGYEFPRYPVPTGETMAGFLRARVDEGARRRYQPYHDRARRQIERELALIEKLKLPGYFLIVWDIVRFAKASGILAQGRGSAANSAVCYALEITAVDPVGMDLLFERFLSEERGEWPDIDIDLPSGDQRERVIQHVYQRFGKLGAAMTANVITYRGRSAAREVGKALGFEVTSLENFPNWRIRGSGEILKTRPTASFARPAWISPIRACANFASSTKWRRTCRGTSASIRAAWSFARGNWIRWCRSNPPPCPAAWWSSGTRKTAPIWGSSRWICSAWA